MIRIFFFGGLLLLLCCTEATAQSFLEPTVGYRFLKNEGYEEDFLLGSGAVVNDEHLGKPNLLLGVGISHFFSNHWMLKIDGKYGSNEVDYSDRGIAGFTRLRFKRLTFSVIPSFHFANNFELGFGFFYDHLHRFQYGSRDRIGTPVSYNNQQQLGYVTALSYALKPFVINLRYTATFAGKKMPQDLIQSGQAIELSFAYRLKVID